MRRGIRWALPVAVVGLLLLGPSAGANPLDRWQWRYPRPQGLALLAVTYGDDLFVAVGESGTVISSSDALNWTLQTYWQFPSLKGVAYSAGLYVAVGDAGTILISTNGAGWAPVASGVTRHLRAVAGNPDWNGTGFARFVAVGEQGTALGSKDGVTWTAVPTGVTNNLNALVCSNGIFAAVGDSGTVIVNDGGTWERRTPPTALNFTAIGACSQGFVTSCDGLVKGGVSYYTSNALLFSDSPLLLTWTNVLTGAGNLRIAGFAAAGGVAVGVGSPINYLGMFYPGVVMTSTNGTQWGTLDFSTSEYSLYAATWGKGMFVAVGARGGILVSTDSTNWTHANGHNSTTICAAASNGDVCIASAGPLHFDYAVSFRPPCLLLSTNGGDWNPSPLSLPAMWSLTVFSNTFYGVSGYSVYSTQDGLQWVQPLMPPYSGSVTGSPAPILRGIAQGNGILFAAGDRGTIVVSTDGVGWVDRSIAVGPNFNTAAFGNDVFVAAGDRVATSPDGVTWGRATFFL